MGAPEVNERFADCGSAVALALDGQQAFLLWENGGDNGNQPATLNGHLLTWQSLEEMQREVRAREGMPLAVVEIDVEVVVDWLRGKRASVPGQAALEVWNLTGDLADSLALPWNDRGRWADRCHTKLTLMSVPEAFGQESYRPRWNPRELKALERVLASAIGLLRGALRSAAPGGSPCQES